MPDHLAGANRCTSMLVIITMFILLVLVLAIIGGAIFWWVNRDNLELPAVVQKIMKKSGGAAPSTATLNFQKRKGIVGTNEMKCMVALTRVAGEKARVYPKVRLADMVNVSREHAESPALQDKLASRNVDFLLAHSRTLAPVLAVNIERKPLRNEMGDIVDTHKTRTDDFSEDVLRLAGIPLLKLVAKEEYDPADLSRRIKLVMAGNTTEQDAEIDVAPTRAAGSDAMDGVRDMASKIKNGLPALKLRRG